MVDIVVREHTRAPLRAQLAPLRAHWSPLAQVFFRLGFERVQAKRAHLTLTVDVGEPEVQAGVWEGEQALVLAHPSLIEWANDYEVRIVKENDYIAILDYSFYASRGLLPVAHCMIVGVTT